MATSYQGNTLQIQYQGITRRTPDTNPCGSAYSVSAFCDSRRPAQHSGWEPVYGGALVTRDSWPKSPDGRRRVIREWHEVSRRVAGGDYRPAVKTGGAWR